MIGKLAAVSLVLATWALVPAISARAQSPLHQGATPPGQTQEAPSNEASPNDIDGETMFATSCGWCHQQGGRAAGRGPKLAGIQKDDAFIINRIKHGKPGTMPAFGRAFSDGQIIAILAYIRSLDDSGDQDKDSHEHPKP